MEDRKQTNKSSLICAKNRRPVETREVYLGTPLLKNIFWYMDLFFWTRLRSIGIDHKSNFKASSLKSWRSLTTEVSLTTTFWNFFSFFLFSQVCFKCLIQLLRHGTPYRLGCLGQVWGILGGGTGNRDRTRASCTRAFYTSAIGYVCYCVYYFAY